MEAIYRCGEIPRIQFDRLNKAAPDFQLRFAGVPGTGDAVGCERGRPPVIPEVVGRPGRTKHYPGLDAGDRLRGEARCRGVCNAARMAPAYF